MISKELTKKPVSKKELQIIAKELKTEILDGLHDPIKIAVNFKQLQFLIDQLQKDKDIIRYIVDESEKEGKTFEKYGATISVCEVGTKWHYEKCDDPELEKLTERLGKLKKKVVERQTMLKNLSDPMADTKTGVVINPAYKTSQTNIKIMLNK